MERSGLVKGWFRWRVGSSSMVSVGVVVWRLVMWWLGCGSASTRH